MMNPKVDFYFNKAKTWQNEIALLRTIVLDCGLTEELKWGTPCYMHKQNNIVLIHVFKAYCALLFFKGVLLKDDKKRLTQQTKNVQSARQFRFTGSKEIKQSAAEIKAFIYEAIDIEKAGLKIELKKVNEFELTKEFQDELTAKPALKKAFEGLTPGRQRAYLLYFSAPKQSKTRVSRIEKSIPQIMHGKGLND